jgi:pimeloyl-ACP methyl ester carboxylesterase
VLTTERPGFGASDPLPGHGFAEPADDIAAILDHTGIDSAHVYGVSGAAPYELALAARHPERVRAVTVVVGAAPATAAEQEQLVDVNATSYRMIMAGDYEGLRAMSAALREEILENPMAAFAGMMEHAAEADRQVMQDPAWQAALAAGWREALRQSADGWVDEDIALETRWDDLDLAGIRTSITWWHGASDAAAPLAAAERVVAALPDARLVRFGDHEGHLAGYHREAEILDELLARNPHAD